MRAKDQLGLDGEAAASVHLERAGMRIIDRRWRCAHGELDIVALDGDTLVFVEVKTRRGLAFGHPFEAITPSKVRRLRMLAALWLEATGQRGPVRLDAVGIIAPLGGAWRVEHLRGIA
ncbi:YraN family protein [Agrococcus sp. Marseille-P2731]|uniref:YraN family protein n=1 Tax=Agrococcus sp. Marseille-P2731 TaxID=1841862 RepID=UPI000930E352|nr:YraN family protein [Agrococcus sp. Marseille-P2731]